ncbi:MAG TPA: hypothetical protein VIM19_12275 [Actinomycetes bacterium]
MTTLTVSRWTKYGKDRLYVNTPDGQRVGWLDLATGQTSIERPELTDAFQAALSDYYGVPGTLLGAAQPPMTGADPLLPAEPDPAPTAADPCEPAWTDLVANRPGQAARAPAVAELAAMRDRTRVGAFLARAFDVKTDERAWRVGADGEETVGARLEERCAADGRSPSPSARYPRGPPARRSPLGSGAAG